MTNIDLRHGDCLDVLAELDDASVDAVITDPPYGLANTTPSQVAHAIERWVYGERAYVPTEGTGGFMGKAWDRFVPPPAVWDECLRVLKPGGHVLAFAGSRTVDLMTLGLRLAGFDIRDSIAWLYGSGFPKSLDVSKAIDRTNGRTSEAVSILKAELRRVFDASGLTLSDLNDRCGFEASGYLRTSSTWAEVLPTPEKWRTIRDAIGCEDDYSDAFRAAEREIITERTMTQGGGTSLQLRMGEVRQVRADITAPATDAARTWQGWGTALKPAFEPIVVARKPLQGTVAANVLQHGTGALNIDACRVGTNGERLSQGSRRPGANFDDDAYEWQGIPGEQNPAGRWPANVVLDETQATALDQQSGELTSGNRKPGTYAGLGYMGSESAEFPGIEGDTGGASRFFYVAEGEEHDEDSCPDCEWETHHEPDQPFVPFDQMGERFRYIAKADASERVRVNGTAHPTVKPLALMRWLVRLVTPPGGKVLDPFTGSGTTGEACILEGFDCILIEREADYLPLIRQRIARRRDPVQAVKGAGEDGGLFDLLEDGGAA